MNGGLDRNGSKHGYNKFFGLCIHAFYFVLLFYSYFESVGKSQLYFPVIRVINFWRRFSQVIEDDFKRIVLFSGQSIKILQQQVVGSRDFVERNQDDWFGLLRQLHVLVHLEMIFRVVHFDKRVEVVLHSCFVLFNEAVERHHIFFLLGKLPEVEKILQYFSDHY